MVAGRSADEENSASENGGSKDTAAGTWARVARACYGGADERRGVKKCEWIYGRPEGGLSVCASACRFRCVLVYVCCVCT
jgi:hypothetical protein